MINNKFFFLGSILLAAGVVACGDDSDGAGGGGGEAATSTTTTTQSASSGSTSTTTSGSPTSTSTGQGGDPGEGGAGGGTGGAGGEGGSGPPAAPELGEQIERMGRPAINTATIDTFAYLTGDENIIAPSTTEIRGASEDAYNEATVGSEEAAAFVPTQALQLTVLDSLDGVCGNVPLYGVGSEETDNCLDDNGDPDLVGGAPLACYGTLATVLNYDVLFVKTADYTSCGIYLGAEADVAATTFGSDILPANEDCGGRRPVDDVINNTYSVVSGVLQDENGDFAFGFDDGITPPADLHPEGFPYLALPNRE